MATYDGPRLESIDSVDDIDKMDVQDEYCGSDDDMFDDQPSEDELLRRLVGTKHKIDNPILSKEDRALVSTHRHLAGAKRIVNVRPNQEINNRPKTTPVELTAENAYDDSKLPKTLPVENIRYKRRHYAKACLHQCARWQTHLFCETDYVKGERRGIVKVCGTADRPIDSCSFCQGMTAEQRLHREKELNRIRKVYEEKPNYKPSNKHNLPRDIYTNAEAKARTEADGDIWEENPWTYAEVKHRLKQGLSQTAGVITVDAACQTVELRIRKALDATDGSRYIYVDQPCDKPIAWLKPLVTRFVKEEDAEKLYGGMIDWDDFVPADLLRNNQVTTIGTLEPPNDGINYDDTAMATTMNEIKTENAQEKADFNNNIKVEPDPHIVYGQRLNVLPADKTYRRCTPYEIRRHQKELERIAAEEKAAKRKDKNKKSTSSSNGAGPQPSTSTADPDPDVQIIPKFRKPKPFVPPPEVSDSDDSADLSYHDCITGAPPRQFRWKPICNMITPHVNFNITAVDQDLLLEIQQVPYDVKIRRVSDGLHPRDQRGSDEMNMPWTTFPVYREILTEISSMLTQTRIELDKQPDVLAVRERCSSLSTLIDLGAILPRDSEIPAVAMDMTETVCVHTAKHFYLKDDAGLTNDNVCRLEEKLRAALLAHSHMSNYDDIIDQAAADISESPGADRLLRVLHARRGATVMLRRALVESFVSLILWRRRQNIIVTERLDKDYYIDLLVAPVYSTTDLFSGRFSLFLSMLLLTDLF